MSDPVVAPTPTIPSIPPVIQPETAISQVRSATTSPPPTWTLALIISGAVAVLTMVSPALPLIRAEFAITANHAQLFLSSYLIALAVGQIFHGTLSDRYGRRPVLLIGSAVFCIGGLAAAFAPSANILITLGVVQGIGTAATTTMGRSIVNDSYSRSQAAYQFATITAVMATVPILGLLFGGIIAEFVGWRGSMVLLGCIGLAVLVCSFLLVNESHHVRRSTFDVKQIFQSYLNVFRNHVFLLFMATGSLQGGMFYSMTGFMSYQFFRLGVGPAEFGAWFAFAPLGYLAGNLTCRKFTQRVGLENMSILGCCFSICALVLMTASHGFGLLHPTAYAIPLFGFGFSNGIVMANVLIGGTSAAGSGKGTATGIFGAVQMATGGIAGSVIAGLGGADDLWVGLACLITMATLSAVAALCVRQMLLR